jgi:hypothetical protein
MRIKEQPKSVMSTAADERDDFRQHGTGREPKPAERISCSNYEHREGKQ